MCPSLESITTHTAIKVSVVLGSQWGDEGKGKLVDLLAEHADVVARCQVSTLFILFEQYFFRTFNTFMGSEPPKYLVIHQFFYLRFFYFIVFCLIKSRACSKFLKRLGKVVWFHYASKNKGVSQKHQNKNFIKKIITKYFGGSDPMNELIV